MIDLSTNEKKIVLDLAKDNFNNKMIEIFVFGSRAKNTARQYSDLDIAIKGNEIIPTNQLQTLKYSYAQSDLPFMVDVIDLNSISTEFYQAIQSDLIPLTES
jgi:Nucleotidyltransferase domain.